MVLLYATFPNRSEALSTARTLLSEKLIACANVIDNATSIYVWEGEVKENSEAILFAKTTEAQQNAVITRVKALHSYELPCILVLPVERGYTPFLRWVEGEVS